MKNLFLTALLLTGITVLAQSEAEKAASTIRKSDIEAHIYFLASDELKGRETGSHELNIAAAYLANNLRKSNVIPAGDQGSYYRMFPWKKLAPLKT